MVTASDLPDAIDRARRLVDQADRVTVLTGAGISTDSGIPDFRGPNGVWTKNPEAEKMATIDVYLADPDVRRAAWRNRLESKAWKAQPNDGHRALVGLERSGKLHTLITQNIDGLHQAAGSDPAAIVEVHGNIHEVVCMSCGDRGPMEATLDRVRSGEDDPSCRDCGGILKSATISFGQALVPDDLRRAERAAVEADLLLAVGTSLAVFPIADVVPIAKQTDAAVVIVNAEPTQFDSIADAVIGASISDVLGQVVGQGES